MNDLSSRHMFAFAFLLNLILRVWGCTEITSGNRGINGVVWTTADGVLNSLPSASQAGCDQNNPSLAYKHYNENEGYHFHLLDYCADSSSSVAGICKTICSLISGCEAYEAFGGVGGGNCVLFSSYVGTQVSPSAHDLAQLTGSGYNCHIKCTVPSISTGVQTWSGANCASGAADVAPGTSCQITAASGFACTSPGLCGSDGNFANTGQCVATTTSTTTTTTRIGTTATTRIDVGTTTTAANTTATTLSRPKIRNLLGQMTLSVSSPSSFVQEANVTFVLQEAIALLYEVVLDWVRNVTIERVSRRLFDNINAPSAGDVDVNWNLVIPPDTHGEIIVEVLVDNFDKKSIAEVTQTVNTLLNSGVLGDSYDVNVTWKYTAAEPEDGVVDEAGDSESDTAGPIIIVVIVSASIGVCALFATIYFTLHEREKRRKKRANGLLANFRKSQAAFHKEQFSINDLLHPPKIITPEQGQQLRDFAKAMMDDVSSGVTVPVFITFSDGQREADAIGYGPGSYYAAAIIKYLHDNGIPCFCELMYPETGHRGEFCKQLINAQAEVLIVLQTKALYYERCSLTEIYVAQQAGIELLPLRFDADLPSTKESWPEIERTDVEGMVMVTDVVARFCKLNSVPSPPYTVVNQPSVLEHFTTDLKIKVGNHGSLDTVEEDPCPHSIGLNDIATSILLSPMSSTDVDSKLAHLNSSVSTSKSSTSPEHRQKDAKAEKSDAGSSQSKSDRRRADDVLRSIDEKPGSARVGRSRTNERSSDSTPFRGALSENRSEGRRREDRKPKKAQSVDALSTRREANENRSDGRREDRKPKKAQSVDALSSRREINERSSDSMQVRRERSENRSEGRRPKKAKSEDTLSTGREVVHGSSGMKKSKSASASSPRRESKDKRNKKQLDV